MHWECNEREVRGKTPPEWLRSYFRMEYDLEGWSRSQDRHPFLQYPVKALNGLRLLRQEPWECTISYMFAQGLSVKVIRHALGKFCLEHGKTLEGTDGIRSFPEARDIARLSPDFLKPVTNNYRARADRIIRMARAVEANVISLDHLKAMPCDEARETLMILDGIGPKIADCIMLFSLDQDSAFPVDRWVLRAMKRYFKSVKLLGAGEEAPTPSQYFKIVQKARAAFGGHCGWAGQYLFVFLRLAEDEKLRKELFPFCQTLDRFLESGRRQPVRTGGSKTSI